MNTRDLLLGLTPPLVVRAAREARRRARGMPRAGFTGDYPDWERASAASGGYDSAAILAKTRAAMIEVREGRAAYERDSVLFDDAEYAWPLVAGLLRVAAANDGRLDVLDFGGSLGSTYFQNRALLSGLSHLSWTVVEQPEHVRVGREEFETEVLGFAASIGEAVERRLPNVVVLGSVLQYLPEPHTTFAELASLPLDNIIVDRTPFIDADGDRLCVQQTDPWIYDATYPCWLMAHGPFVSRAAELGFSVVAEFPTIDTLEGPVPVTYRGMILERGESDGGSLA